MKHKHHIIESHNGKRIRTDKTILVTIEKHAQYHKGYWEKWGFQEDRVAWLSLTEQLKNPELFVETSRIGGLNNRGKPKSEEHKRKISKSLKGRMYGPQGEKRRKKISESMKGNINSKNHSSEKYRKKQSKVMKEAWKKRKLLPG
jgi:hypothetical protein